jgi:flavin reductase (DIM6/NTAB) family NADH-FMN oxidoreductase RutF
VPGVSRREIPQRGKYLNKSTLTEVLGKIPYGLYIVGSKTRNGIGTIVANWVCQISFEPTLVSIAIESDSEMRGDIEQSRCFSINMLGSDAGKMAKLFLRRSTSDSSTINGLDFSTSTSGVPFLRDAVASFDCTVVDSVLAGDHIVFIGLVGEVVNNRVGSILTLADTGLKYQK